MEVSKLYNLTDEIVRKEGESEIDTLFGQILTSLTTLKSNPNNPTILETYEKNKTSLITKLRESELNELTPSNLKIAHNIGAVAYIGNTLADNIENLLSINSFNITAVVTEFQKLQTEREEYFSNLTTLNDIFKSFKIKMHWWNDSDSYEIGIMVPTGITNDHRIPKVTKHLNKWNQIIKDFNEVTGSHTDDIKIAFQDIGTLEYFFQSPELTATAIVTGIERLAALYKKILEIRKLRQDLKKLDFPKKEQATIAKHESDVSEKEIKQITNDIFSEHGKKKFEGTRRNELKNAVTLHLKWIAKQIDKGEIIEVNTPGLNEPEQKDKSDEDFKKIKNKYEVDKAKIDLLKSKANLFKEITGTAKNVFKFLKSPDEEE